MVTWLNTGLLWIEQATKPNYKERFSTDVKTRVCFSCGYISPVYYYYKVDPQNEVQHVLAHVPEIFWNGNSLQHVAAQAPGTTIF